MRHALRDFAATFRAHPEFRLSVNVAASDLADQHFLAMLENALEEAGVRADNLTIEITESSTARHEVAIATIRRLHQKGHGVHIDDFGTGYSSLSYLQDLAIDAINHLPTMLDPPMTSDPPPPPMTQPPPRTPPPPDDVRPPPR